MNARERYLETLLFGTPDRIPFGPGGARESTRKRWHSEGLPEDRSYMSVIHENLGIQPGKSKPRVTPGVNLRMIPTFEEKVLEHKDGHYIVQDWMGNITEISDEYDYTCLLYTSDAADE